MTRPLRSASNLRTSDFSSNYPPLILRIFIYVNKQSPLLCIQAPPSLPVPVQFPSHYGPPFVRVQALPAFYRLFHVQITIQELDHSSATLRMPSTEDTFPFQIFNMFSICITPCNTADRPPHDNLGTYEVSSTFEDFQQPSASTVRPTTSLQRPPPPASVTFAPKYPNLQPLCSPPPTTAQPRPLRWIDKHLLPRTSTPPRLQQLTMKPLPLPPYHLRPPMYYSRSIITPAPSRPPSINNDATPSAATAPISTLILISYLCHVFQRVHSTLRNSLRRPGRQRHDLFVLISSFSLTNPLFPATITHDQHHRDLANCGECPFSNDSYVTLSTHGSDKSHITKTSPHRQRLVDGMPSNQLPQATFRFPHPCQLGCTVPCYIFFLFSTMELSSPLCLVTDAYAPYAPYAPFYGQVYTMFVFPMDTLVTCEFVTFLDLYYLLQTLFPWSEEFVIKMSKWDGVIYILNKHLCRTVHFRRFSISSILRSSSFPTYCLSFRL